MDDEISQLAEQLRKVEHFKNLSKSDLISIVGSGQVFNFNKDETIYYEGDPCSGMYVLLQGKVNLCKSGPEGQVSIISSLRPVIMFNEVAVLDCGCNPTSARAIEKSIVWRITCDRFQNLMNLYPQVGTGLLKILAIRNRMIMSQYGDLSFKPVSARIAIFLITTSSNGNKVIHRSEYSINDIASRIISTPEVVSRALKLMKEQNIIEVNRKEISILDIEALHKYTLNE